MMCSGCGLTQNIAEHPYDCPDPECPLHRAVASAFLRPREPGHSPTASPRKAGIVLAHKAQTIDTSNGAVPDMTGEVPHAPA